MKLKAGMKVKIIENWREHEEYNQNDYVDDETEYEDHDLPEDLCGIPKSAIDPSTIHTVLSVDTDEWNGRDYIKLEGSPFSWPHSVFKVI